MRTSRPTRSPTTRPPPQQLLSQWCFIHPDFHQLVVDLFNADVYGHQHRVQHLLRSATKHPHAVGHEAAAPKIVAAGAEMRRRWPSTIPFHPPRSPCCKYRNRP